MQYSPSVERFLELSYDLAGRNRQEELRAAVLEKLRAISTSAGLDSSQPLSDEEVWEKIQEGSIHFLPTHSHPSKWPLRIIKFEISKT